MRGGVKYRCYQYFIGGNRKHEKETNWNDACTCNDGVSAYSMWKV